jgi:hypothetical protein
MNAMDSQDRSSSKGDDGLIPVAQLPVVTEGFDETVQRPFRTLEFPNATLRQTFHIRLTGQQPFIDRFTREGRMLCEALPTGADTKGFLKERLREPLLDLLAGFAAFGSDLFRAYEGKAYLRQVLRAAGHRLDEVLPAVREAAHALTDDRRLTDEARAQAHDAIEALFSAPPDLRIQSGNPPDFDLHIEVLWLEENNRDRQLPYVAHIIVDPTVFNPSNSPGGLYGELWHTYQFLTTATVATLRGSGAVRADVYAAEAQARWGWESGSNFYTDLGGSSDVATTFGIYVKATGNGENKYSIESWGVF